MFSLMEKGGILPSASEGVAVNNSTPVKVINRMKNTMVFALIGRFAPCPLAAWNQDTHYFVLLPE
jgi:hypothetical protein